MVLIEIYTRSECPLCETAKRMMMEGGITFKEYMLGVNISRDEVLKRFPESKTVPIIVVDGQQIKEVNEFKLLLENQ
jgi:glutaredoxin